MAPRMAGSRPRRPRARCRRPVEDPVSEDPRDRPKGRSTTFPQVNAPARCKHEAKNDDEPLDESGEVFDCRL